MTEYPLRLRAGAGRNRFGIKRIRFLKRIMVAGVTAMRVESNIPWNVLSRGLGRWAQRIGDSTQDVLGGGVGMARSCTVDSIVGETGVAERIRDTAVPGSRRYLLLCRNADRGIR